MRFQQVAIGEGVLASSYSSFDMHFRLCKLFLHFRSLQCHFVVARQIVIRRQYLLTIGAVNSVAYPISHLLSTAICVATLT